MIDKGAASPGPRVSVRAMSPAEFAGWQERAITSYADDVSRASDKPLASALAQARESWARLLPDGLVTAGTWLLRVLDADGTDVGVLWIGPRADGTGAAYVYDLEIDEQHRGRGLGRAAMLAAEDLVRAAGIGEIGLSVFGFNERARRLYDSLGYRVVATQMTKKLETSRTGL